jgi:hypothetical protein
MSIMGFDPMADRGTAPFETADSTLRLAEELGVGTRDLKKFEVIGARIADLVLDYRKATQAPQSVSGWGRSIPERISAGRYPARR